MRAAAEEWLDGWDENGAEWEFWVERNEAARSAFAGFSATADEVAVTTSVSRAVSAFVSALDFTGERNRIVISDYEFPTVGQIARSRRCAVPRSSESGRVRRIDSTRALRSVGGRANGARVLHGRLLPDRTPARRPSIAEVAHTSGALVLADSYQAVGALELDVGSLGADVVTGGTVKYLLGSAGLAFMWVRSSLIASLLPTQTGWFADEDIFEMSIADYSPRDDAVSTADTAGPFAVPGRCRCADRGRGRRARDRGARQLARRPAVRRPRRSSVRPW